MASNRVRKNFSVAAAERIERDHEKERGVRASA